MGSGSPDFYPPIFKQVLHGFFLSTSPLFLDMDGYAAVLAAERNSLPVFMETGTILRACYQRKKISGRRCNSFH